MQAQVDRKKLENQLMDVLISPCRLGVMNNLAESNNGLSLDDITKQMAAHSPYLNKHIEKLIQESIIQNKEGRLYLTKDGKNLYKALVQIATKIKTD